MFKVSISTTNHAKLDASGRIAAVGFSTRGLVEALQEAGLRPISLDAFADRDCIDAAVRAYRIDAWGSDSAVAKIVSLLKLEGSPPVVMAGGTENWGTLIERLNAEFSVLGPSLEQCVQLRNLNVWRESAQAAGVGFPESRTFGDLQSNSDIEPCSSRKEGTWLVKSLAGSGGLHVSRATSLPISRSAQIETAKKAKHARAAYLQRFIPGRVLGAQCVFSRSECRLLGITEAFTAAEWPGPTEFAFRGCWGRDANRRNERAGGRSEREVLLELCDSRQRAAVLRLCEQLHQRSGYCGWAGIDLIEDAERRLWLLELNPRWTSGMELLSPGGLVAAHLRAGGIELAQATHPATRDPSASAVYAKAIVYAWADIRLSTDMLEGFARNPSLADVPASTSARGVVAAGHPLLTLLAQVDSQGLDAGQAKAQLLEQLRGLRDQVQVQVLSCSPAAPRCGRYP